MTTDVSRPQVLIIDDELQIRRLLRFTLEEAGYEVHEAEDGKRGLGESVRQPFDVVILDLGLPDIHGLEVLKTLRSWSNIPVLILSVFARDGDKIAALDAGADDYLTKPFSGGELLARLRALLRRPRAAEGSSVLQFGALEVDLSRRLVKKDGVLIKLTGKEYDLLRMLVLHRGKVLTHGQILTEIWGAGSEAQTHYLRIYMLRLRQKLEAAPDVPQHFQTESGIGYRFVE